MWNIPWTCALLHNLAENTPFSHVTPWITKELPSWLLCLPKKTVGVCLEPEYLCQNERHKCSQMAQVQVENDNVLKISGERKREDAVADGEVKYVRVERSAGKFMRKFNLPSNANLDNISAACQDGLLTIIVPKNPPPDIYRPRTFDVAVSSANLGQWWD